MSISFKGALGALADAGLSIRDVDGVVGQFAHDFVYQARLARRGPRRRGRGSRRCCRPRPRSPRGWPPGCSSSGARPACTSTGRRPRRGRVRAASSWRRSGCSPPPSSRWWRAATCTCTAPSPTRCATVAAVIRNNGHVNPEAIYHGRGPFTPQDILDSRMVADPFHLLDCATASEGGCGIVLTRADLAVDGAAAAGVRARRQRRQRWHRVQEPADVGARRQPPRRPRERHRRATGGGGLVPRRRPRADRRRRVRVLRPVLVRDHPPVRGVRLLRRRRGRRLRDGRHHRAGWAVPGHHRRRRDVVQPRRRVVPDAATGDPQRGAAPRHVRRARRSTGPRSRCAPTAVRERCSTT